MLGKSYLVPAFYYIKDTEPLNYIVFTLLSFYLIVKLTGGMFSFMKSKPKLLHNQEPLMSYADINSNIKAMRADLLSVNQWIQNHSAAPLSGSNSQGSL